MAITKLTPLEQVFATHYRARWHTDLCAQLRARGVPATAVAEIAEKIIVELARHQAEELRTALPAKVRDAVLGHRESLGWMLPAKRPGESREERVARYRERRGRLIEAADRASASILGSGKGIRIVAPKT
ncbi:MAG: hypothetical protein FJY54_12145 [Betaproteobacteria bacterium]|nr:hypothetical protein [Betaproteobacteria bacterium]